MQAGTFQRVNLAKDQNPITFAPSFTLSPTFQVPIPQQQSQPTRLPWEEPEKEISTTQSIFMVPFPRDANFLGRQNVLDLIAEKFEKTHAVTLTGLGGIG